MHNPSDPSTPALNYKALKTVAIVFGVILVTGFLFIVTYAISSVKAGSKGCEAVTVKVEGTEIPIKIEERDDHLTVWVKDTGGALAIRRYAMCGGKLLRDVRVSGNLPELNAPHPGQQPQMPPQQ